MSGSVDSAFNIPSERDEVLASDSLESTHEAANTQPLDGSQPQGLQPLLNDPVSSQTALEPAGAFQSPAPSPAPLQYPRVSENHTTDKSSRDQAGSSRDEAAAVPAATAAAPVLSAPEGSYTEAELYEFWYLTSEGFEHAMSRYILSLGRPCNWNEWQKAAYRM